MKVKFDPDPKRRAMIATLKGEAMNSRKFAEAIRDADLRTLVDAAKECILKPIGTAVNRSRFEFLLDRVVTVVTRPPAMELAAKKEGDGHAS